MRSATRNQFWCSAGLICGVLSTVVGCGDVITKGGSNTQTQLGLGSAPVASLPACSWSQNLATDAGGQCVAARTYLTCQLAGGAVQACTSDNALSCPSPPLATGGGSGDAGACTNQCTSEEYVISCRGSATLPNGCRSLLSGPGLGGAIGCCPCGS